MARAIYIHIPYCRKKCPYCDFSSVAAKEPPFDAYAAALLRELEDRANECKKPVGSVYFGGGTPSLLTPEHIRKILDGIRGRAGIEKNAEITLEANPETIDPAKLTEFAEAGVNRLSVGVQSFSEKSLRALGRNTTAKETHRGVDAALSSPIKNVSLDMIFGLWEGHDPLPDARAIADAKAAHISAYCLTVYDETPLGKQIAEGLRLRPGDDKAAGEYEDICALFAESGYEQYEISNFARPGFHSRHNAIYWERKSYVGLGAGAASFIEKAPGARYGIRFRNECEPDDYIHLVEKGGDAKRDREIVTAAGALAETVFLGMRMLRGVSISAIEGRFGFDFRKRFDKPLRLLKALDLVEETGDRLRLTRKGLFLSDEVFAHFV